ncbi:MAG TPA: Gfo/Idh/MocA family oxidoreductase, partial [Humisphaera sp.]|nr:Gfo/Idh/MocA family oxidoreductase [Humisphaera sp.]
ARAKTFAEREKCDYVTDYRELLKRPDVQIVCVTTPSGSHAPIGMDVLRAGKNLVLEKPMAMSTKDAAALIRTAEEKKVTLAVISQRRFEPQHRAVKKVIDEGALGKLLLTEVSLPFFRSQEYYDSADWRGTIAQDGGALMNQGIHSIDLMLWFAGAADRVIGKTATQAHKMEAEDLGLAIVQFKNGAFGTIMASTSIRPGFPAAINFYGDKGTIKLEGSNIVHWTVPDREKPELQTVNYGGVADPRAISFVYHQMQLTNIIESIEAGRPPEVRGEDGLRAVQLIESIYKSSTTDRPIAIAADFNQSE